LTGKPPLARFSPPGIAVRSRGLQLGVLTAEEALALERPAMTYVREQLRQRLGRQIGRAWQRWLHPTSGRRPGDRFL
jgi:hypothetical protein